MLLLTYASSGQTLKLSSITEVKPLKRGKEYNLNWSGGKAEEKIRIELHRASGKVQSWEETQNDGGEVVKLSKKLKPGKDYLFKFFAGDVEVGSEPVVIKRRIPLAVTISAAVIVPATIILLFSLDKNDIPDPILPEFPSAPPTPGG